MITKFSENNSNKSNNQYYNLEGIFEKFILRIWTCQKPGDAHQKSKHSFSVFCIICFRMLSSECLMFSDWLHRLDPSLPNSVVPYKRNFFRIMANQNSRESLGVRNAFTYVNMGRVRGFETKSEFRNLISSVCNYK